MTEKLFSEHSIIQHEQPLLAYFRNHQRLGVCLLAGMDPACLKA